MAVKFAFVTGGSRGIGEAIVRRFAADGVSVAFTYVSSEERAHALARELTRDGVRVLPVKADSASVHETRAAIDQAASAFGHIDALVTNAGIMAFGDFATFAIEDFDRAMNVNVRATFVAIQHAIKHMPKGSRIVTIGSNTAEQAMIAGSTVYGMTKSAVARMARGLALDLVPYGITITNVQPGPTATALAPTEGPHYDMMMAKSPVKRIAAPSEIADFVVWLSGPQASYVNGASLTIDGGFTA